MNVLSWKTADGVCSARVHFDGTRADAIALVNTTVTLDGTEYKVKGIMTTWGPGDLDDETERSAPAGEILIIINP